MTAQIHDSFPYQGKSYSIVGVSGQGLFKPEEYGLTPFGTCSACWRGFHCTYAIADHRLTLKTLNIGFDQKGEMVAKVGKGPMLGNKSPRRADRSQLCGEWIYDDPDVEIRFTGGLLLGEGFIRELYVHMGFHPAWKYRQMHELLFDSGRLTKTVDRSEFMSQVRDRMSGKPLGPENSADPGDVKRWIEKTFTLDYHW